MLQKNLTRILLLIIFGLLLAGCELSAGGQDEAPPSPEALFTAAAQTAEAMRLQRFGLTPSPPAAEQMIATAAAVTPTPMQVITATLPVPVQATAAPASASSGDKAEYVADVTVPDGTVFAPGESFQKTWRISNTGTTTWSTGYELVFIDGNLLGAAASVPLPEEVAPGEQVDITVDMIAPETVGSYTSYWKLRTPSGGMFGFGSAGTEAIWVKISVGSEGEGGAAQTTEESTSGDTVTGVTLSIDNPEVTGQCPHTFLLTAEISLSKPATVSYGLEAGGVAGESLRVPPLTQRNFEAGVHTVVFEVTIPTNTAGWARVRISAPETLVSNQASFSLTCAS